MVIVDVKGYIKIKCFYYYSSKKNYVVNFYLIFRSFLNMNNTLEHEYHFWTWTSLLNMKNILLIRSICFCILFHNFFDGHFYLPDSDEANEKNGNWEEIGIVAWDVEEADSLTCSILSLTDDTTQWDYIIWYIYRAVGSRKKLHIHRENVPNEMHF